MKTSKTNKDDYHYEEEDIPWVSCQVIKEFQIHTNKNQMKTMLMMK